MIFTSSKEKSRFGDYYAKRLVHTGEKSLVMEASKMCDDELVAIKLYNKAYDHQARKIEKKYKIPSEAEVGKMLNPGDNNSKDSFLVATLGAGKEYNKRTGNRYIVQEFVKGVTLKKLISCEDKRIEVNATRWAFQVCAALHEIHQAGFIYRDMCSDNIIITEQGSIKLIDLGFVAPQNIAFEERGGTPSYMAPEQVEVKPLTPKTDIYSLGVVFYEILTGKLPYTARIAGNGKMMKRNRHKELMNKQVKAPEPVIEEEYKNKNPFLADAISKCLRKDPQKRFDSVQEISHLLNN